MSDQIAATCRSDRFTNLFVNAGIGTSVAIACVFSYCSIFNLMRLAFSLHKLIILQGSPMYLQSNVVESFIALHEGSIVGDKTQPVIELYPQEKWVAPENDIEWQTKADCSQVCVVRGGHSWREEDGSLSVGSRCIDFGQVVFFGEIMK